MIDHTIGTSGARFPSSLTIVTEIVSLADVTAPEIPAALQSRLKGGVISIGNFDGVHRGHASLLRQTIRVADEIGGPSIACLFDPHPITILRPELAPKRLTSVDERARRMHQLGIDFLVVCEASPELLSLTATEFFDALVVDALMCRGMVEGENFCFGKDRAGDTDLLANLCRQHDIVFQVASMQSLGGDIISSTRIRDLLSEGQVRRAAELMQHRHLVQGRVIHGDARGRTIGFPTANLDQTSVVIPAPGVYAGTTEWDTHRFPCAIHIGESPTFESGDAGKIEAHLIGFQGDLYGQTLSVRFVDFVRKTKRFDSADDLIKQLQQDIQSAQQLLDQSNGPQAS